MKRIFRKLYEHIEVTLLVLLSISFITGMYMMNKAGGPTTMDYITQVVIGVIIIVDVVFLIGDRKKTGE
ncbi:hypothetical protein D0U04_04510 [Bacillus clarus]|uniref:Putative membrane protein n=1 Tax=Bacillus clarus TaxID=2338372 RepID=A0A090YZE0_9BACI|nr:hypothetical protein [Bacillus clarus]KFN03305.1 putative membrane protein [Bacillus clarus]RFT68140.1 hypothetical protein D0U04_04510 [Bacillus clarus]